MDIKIFVSCHKKCKVFSSKYIMPIQVGTELSEACFPGMLHDNDGEDNISDLNGMYCELTAQYWAWKNIKADYYGFMHYRRYFSLNSALLPEDCFGNVCLEEINDKNVKLLGLNDENIEKVVSQYDVITLIPNNIKKLGDVKTVYEHAQKESPYHRIEDLKEIMSIISEKYPNFKDAMKKYLSSEEGYFCNMYILRRDIFEDYCSWLFDILETHRKSKDFYDYSVDEYRVSGFWAERLWGIYYTYLKEKRSDLKYKEVQKSFFKSTDLDTKLHPAFSRNNIPIVFSSDDNYVPILATAVKSIATFSTKNNNYDIVILHQDITKDNQSKLIKEFESESLSIRFVNVKKFFEDRHLITPAHFTIEIYFRLAMQDVMQEYDKVVYLDSDLVVNKDIAELYFTPLGDNLIAAVQDVDSAGCYKGFDPKRKEYFESVLKLQDPYSYFNSGVIVMNLNKFRHDFTSEYIIKLAENEDYIFPDQDVLNILCENKVLYLDERWNTLINHKSRDNSRLEVARLAPHKIYNNYLKARKDPWIIHFAGYQKPWKYRQCDMSEYFWRLARETSFYEQLMLMLFLDECERNRLSYNQPIQTEERKEHQAMLNIEGVDDPIYIDGIMVKFVNKINKFLPIGSKRRNTVKAIAGKFFK